MPKRKKAASELEAATELVGQLYKDVDAIMVTLPAHEQKTVIRVLAQRYNQDIGTDDTMAARMRSLLGLTQSGRSKLIAAWAEEIEQGRRRQ